MNRKTFLKTVLGLVAAPSLVAKALVVERPIQALQLPSRLNPEWVTAGEGGCWELHENWVWYYIKDNGEGDPWKDNGGLSQPILCRNSLSLNAPILPRVFLSESS